MTATGTSFLVTLCTSTASAGAASYTIVEATAVEAGEVAGPWWVVAIVVPLSAFVGLMVRWMMVRQDQMHEETRAATEKRELQRELRESKREEREEARAEHAALQTSALQGCLGELRALNDRHVSTRDAIFTSVGILQQNKESLAALLGAIRETRKP